MEPVLSLNYSASCIDSWRSAKSPHPAMVDLIRVLSVHLHAAPKFMPPAGGRPLEDAKSIGRIFNDLRLPFPCVALEYRAAGVLGEQEVACGRRISLVWETDRGIPADVATLIGADLAPRRGLLVQSITYIDDLGEWMPILGMVEVHLDESCEQMRHDDIDPEMRELTAHRLVRGQVSSDYYPSSAYPTVPAFVTSAGGMERALNLIAADTGDEVLAAISFAALSSCGNVHSEVVCPPEALNKKRIKNGKTAFFDTRILTVGDGGYVATRAGEPGEHQSGLRASARPHLRRGHIRRVSDKNIWVNAAAVNACRDRAPTPSYALRQRGG